MDNITVIKTIESNTYRCILKTGEYTVNDDTGKINLPAGFYSRGFMKELPIVIGKTFRN